MTSKVLLVEWFCVPTSSGWSWVSFSLVNITIYFPNKMYKIDSKSTGSWNQPACLAPDQNRKLDWFFLELSEVGFFRHALAHAPHNPHFMGKQKNMFIINFCLCNEFVWYIPRHVQHTNIHISKECSTSRELAHSSQRAYEDFAVLTGGENKMINDMVRSNIELVLNDSINSGQHDWNSR